MVVRLLLLVVGCLTLTACTQQKYIASGAAPSMSATGPALTVAECEAFGRRYAEALTAQDRKALEDCIRLKEWMRRSVSDIEIPAKARPAFERAVDNPSQFFDRFEGARAKFLRVKHVD